MFYPPLQSHSTRNTPLSLSQSTRRPLHIDIYIYMYLYTYIYTYTHTCVHSN